MPIHDWTKAPRGYFHHFHQRWAGEICDALNGGRLPSGIFALVEKYAGAAVPDVLALEARAGEEPDGFTGRGGIVLATEPKTRFISRASEEAIYAAKANQVVLHRGDETIAVIEIVSPGNKSSAQALQQFVNKSLGLLERGIHLLVIDLFPPTRRDPQGIHQAIWSALNEDAFELPADKQLTLASYVADVQEIAYVEPVAVGDVMPDMPVFLDTEVHVPVPLEETYVSTWTRCPKEFRERVAGLEQR